MRPNRSRRLSPSCSALVVREFDCAVIGAGLAGATLAVGLARCGLRVAAIDARPPASATAGRDIRGLALASSSQRLLVALGLWSGLREHLTPIQRVRVSAQGHYGSTTLRAALMGVPALGYVCAADRLLAALDAALAAAPLLTPFYGTTLHTLAPAADRVALQLSSAAGLEHLSARLIVAADGSHSVVRRHYEIASRQFDYGQTAVVANLDVEHPEPHTAVERFTPDGPCALLPLGGARHVLVRTARSTEAQALLAASPAAFLADVQARFGWRYGRFSGLGSRRAHPLVLHRAQQLVAPRAVLIGNAANTIHPNAAQGLNLALRDVATLLDCLAGTADPGAPAALANYAAQRQPDHERTVNFSHGLARLFTLEVPLVGVGRGLTLAACELLPPLRTALMARLMGWRAPPNDWLRGTHEAN
ncbi:MAG: 2-octaprenyl-6-methoxyphenyl hydroxylase [Gammaproteobacteria bacterium]|nr:2-octaprenyl-6-methoxyphenyl hydroxylase [Gammaproteobacteria bacterium]